MSRPYLFSDVDWFSVEQAQKARMKEEISKLPPNRILSTPIEDLCDYFNGTYHLEVPVLHTERTVAEQHERDVDVSHDFLYSRNSAGPHYVKGTEISVMIPYTGEAELFKVRPSTFTLSPPGGEIGASALTLRIAGVQLEGKAVRVQMDKTTAEIEGYLNTLRGNVEGYNNSIRAWARQQIEVRRSKLLSDQNLVAELGFPLKERAGMPRTYAPPEVKGGSSRRSRHRALSRLSLNRH